MDTTPFALEFRPFQTELLQTFQSKLDAGENRFHFLSPPGSGKTLLGLEMIRRIGQPAVVLVPNSAIQIQWIKRLELAGSWMNISTNPHKEKDIWVLTYQSATLPGEVKGLHPKAHELMQRIARRKTIVLDECHHLVAHWGKTLQRFTNKDNILIGLTATPPLDRSTGAQKNYLELLGEIDSRIPLPAVIKEGFLTPFQDLVWLALPTQEERLRLKAADQDWQTLVGQIEGNSTIKALLTQEGKEKQEFSLSSWILHRLDNFQTKKGRVLSVPEISEAYPELFESYLAYLQEKAIQPPASVSPAYQWDRLLSLEGWLWLVWDLKEQGKISGPMLISLEAKLTDLGFRLESYGPERAGTGSRNILTASASKIEAAKQILIWEHQQQGEDLRALILSDFDIEKEGERLSTRQILSALVQDSQTDELDPIMVTGKALWVDDDLYPVFEEAAKDYFLLEKKDCQITGKADHGFYQIEGSGKDWNTRTFVDLVTVLLERGTTQCLVGTRSLLGEGWDSLALNTLVDLTVSTSYVTVNQIQGRTLRIHPEKPAKVANNWDVMILDEGELGDDDRERLERKHSKSLGLSEDGFIEKGLGHVHPRLVGTGHRQLLESLEQINAEMKARAADRLAVYQAWKARKEYLGKEITTMEARLDESQSFPLVRAQEWALAKPFGFGTRTLISLVLAFLGSLILDWLPSYILVSVVFPSLWIGLGWLLYGGKVLQQRGQARLQRAKKEQKTRYLREMARAVFFSLQELDLLPRDLREEALEVKIRVDGSFRAVLRGDESGVFEKSFGELFEPLGRSRYLLEAWNFSLKGFGRLKDHTFTYFPMPSAFDNKKSKSQVFLKHWYAYVGLADLHFIRRGEAKLLGAKLLGQRPLKGQFVHKTLWV
jgi:superfamily II DNA or RNA helicase